MKFPKSNIILMWASLCLLAFTIGIYTYYSQIDGEYINVPVRFHYWNTHNTITHETTEKSYYPGDIVYGKISVKKDRVWPGVVQWILVDGSHYCYPPRSGVLEKGIEERIVEIEKIPVDAKPGVYYFTGTIMYELNFIKRKIYLPIQSNTFIVKSKLEGRNHG